MREMIIFRICFAGRHDKICCCTRVEFERRRQFQDVEPLERGVIYYNSNLGKLRVCEGIKRYMH